MRVLRIFSIMHIPINRCFNYKTNKWSITLIAEGTEEPLASSAAIHDAKVQPVPWVLEVFIRGERNS